MKKPRYDLIDAHWVYPDGWAAVEIGNDLGIPVVVSARGDDINVYSGMRKIGPLLNETLTSSEHIIAVSQSIKRNIVSLGIKEEKISVIPNGVCTKTFHLGSKEKARRKLGISGKVFMAMSVGRLEKEKGFDLLIDSWKIITKQINKNGQLFIAGSGSLFGSLSQQIEELSLKSNVVLVGHIGNEQLVDWYNAADIFCLGSRREGSPNVVLEAGACGLPVVVPSIDAFLEAVHDNKTGISC